MSKPYSNKGVMTKSNTINHVTNFNHHSAGLLTMGSLTPSSSFINNNVNGNE